MWAMRLHAPYQFSRIEVPTPTADDLVDGEVLLRTLAGGLCGSDLPYFRGQLPLPWGDTLTHELADLPGFPMHEVVGEVVASRSPDLQPGSRVVGWAAQDNGIAEYVVTTASGVRTYAADLSPSEAVMLQPLACVLDAAKRIPMAGRDVVVLGLGPIGLLFGHVASSLGARSVVGVDRVARDDIAVDFGFTDTLHMASDKWSIGLADSDRPDVVIEAIGHQQATFAHAAEALRQDGLLYYFGIPDEVNYTIPFQTLLRKNLTVATGITVRKQEALASADDYLQRYPELAKRYVTNHFAAGQVTEAYAMAVAPSPGRAKIVIDF